MYTNSDTTELRLQQTCIFMWNRMVISKMPSSRNWELLEQRRETRWRRVLVFQICA